LCKLLFSTPTTTIGNADNVDILLEVGVFSNLPNAQQSISPSTKNAKQANGNAKGVGQ